MVAAIASHDFWYVVIRFAAAIVVAAIAGGTLGVVFIKAPEIRRWTEAKLDFILRGRRAE